MNEDFLNRRRRGGRKFLFAPLFILLILLLGGIVYWLWNAILPEVTGIKPLKYPQALGLLVLCRLLFGNFGWKKNGDGRRFGQEFKERFRNMSEEDRARLKEEWRKRCRR